MCSVVDASYITKTYALGKNAGQVDIFKNRNYIKLATISFNYDFVHRNERCLYTFVLKMKSLQCFLDTLRTIQNSCIIECILPDRPYMQNDTQADLNVSQ